jgi:hypothetical protein
MRQLSETASSLMMSSIFLPGMSPCCGVELDGRRFLLAGGLLLARHRQNG